MKNNQREFIRLKKVKTLVAKKFPHFGPNKKQEIERLAYEISKRDNLSPDTIIGQNQARGFSAIKQYLIALRFPCAYRSGEISGIYLPDIEFKAKNVFSVSKAKFYPKKIFLEHAVKKSSIASRFKSAFPNTKIYEISTLKNYLRRQKRYAIADYNARRDTIFIVEQKNDFFKKCPCTKGALGCGYHVFNLGFGCVFDCAYCYLQEYANTPGIILPANLNKFFDKFSAYRRINSASLRMGTGEFCDSLALDNFTQYSLSIIDFFKNQPGAIFEFKTKSANVGNLLKIKHAGNIVVSWSLNPQKIIDNNEFFTAPLSERIDAAKKCAQCGYKIGIHFDPMFYFDGWQMAYKQVIDNLFASLKPKDIAWISIGTFRFKPELKKIIEGRFPDNNILDEELLFGYDFKLRYPLSKRAAMYDFLIKEIRKHSRNLVVYLCMEDELVWKTLKLKVSCI